MGRSPIPQLLLALWVFPCLLHAPAASQNNPSPSPPQGTAELSYSDGPDGLKQMLGDILGAIGAGHGDRAEALVKSLQLPDSAAWFAQVFGPEEGARLAAQYEKDLANFQEGVGAQFRNVAELKEARIHIQLLEDPADLGANDLEKAVLAAMKQPVALYKVHIRTSDSLAGITLGYYVFAQDSFRHVGPVVFAALSSAPPLRIRINGAVQQKNLIRQVMPVYPSSAKAQHIQGTVRLRAIISQDGTVRALTVLEGDPLLAEAAVQAVRQWRYRPTTLLNGIPAEVETTIKVTFSLGG